MFTTSKRAEQLDEEDQRRLESWLIDFDRSWHADRLAEKARELLPPNHPLRVRLLLEMAKIDLERQWRCERRVTVEDYLQAYPELGSSDSVSAELIQAEYEVRLQFGDRAGLEQFDQRFPGQASELRRLVAQTRELISDAELTASDGNTSSLQSAPTPYMGQTGNPLHPLPEVFGRYRIIRILGKGGMGWVYLAHDTQLGRDVALKVPRLSQDDPEVLERFDREARVAATLRHPNICSVYDVGTINGVNYISMAYIDGKPLSDFLDRDKPLPQRHVAEVVCKLALALEYAHQRGIVHRDLKPSNIIADKQHELVITDFGLAKRLSPDSPQSPSTDCGPNPLTVSGQILGTPAYMSPEQALGDAKLIGPASDIYSLGVILYELLTGRHPFDGHSGSILSHIMVTEPQPPSTFRPELAPELEGICRRAMSKKIGDRYASMTELAGALADYLASGRPEKPNLSDPSHKQIRLRSTPIGCSMTITATVAAMLVLAIAIYVKTDKGTVKIVLRDPAAKVEVKVDGEVIGIEKLGNPITIRATEHDLEVTRDAIVVVSRKFSIRRGKETVLEVELDDGAVAKDADRRTAEWVLSRKGTVTVVANRVLRGRVETELDLPRARFTIEKIQFENVPLPDAELLNLEGLTGLRELGFWMTSTEDDGLVHIKDLRSLTLLGISGSRVTDNGLASLQGLTRLQTLHLGWTPKLTDVGLAHLSDLKELKHLILNNTRVGDDGIKHLTGLIDLVELNLGDTLVTDACIEDLKRLRTLRVLHLTGTALTSNGIESLRAAFPHCTIWKPDGTATQSAELKITDGGERRLRAEESTSVDRQVAEWVFRNKGEITILGSDRVVRHLDELPRGDFRITRIEFGGIQVPGDELNQLEKLTHLEELKLWFCPVGDEVMPATGRLTGLKRLVVAGDGTKVTDAGLKQIRELRQLELLHIAFLPEITDAGMANLSQLTALKILSVSNTRLGDAGLMHLKALIKLEELDIGGTRITDAGLNHLAALTELTVLNIGNNIGITDACIEHLKVFTKLREVHLGGTAVTYYGAQWLQAALPDCRIEGVPYKLPSATSSGHVSWPVDKLQREKIPFEELALAGDGDAQQAPRGLVAVFGDSRMKHWNRIGDIAFSPTHDLLATASFDRTVKVWDAGTGKMVTTLRGISGDDPSVTFSPDGRTLVAASSGTIKFWEVDGFRLIKTIERNDVGNLSLAFSPRQKLIATGRTDSSVVLWDADTGNELETLKGHTNWVWAVAFSPDGQTLASASFDETVRLWDVETRQERKRLQAGFKANCVAFSPDNQIVVCGGDHWLAAPGTVKAWNVKTGDELFTLGDFRYGLYSLAFTGDSGQLVTGAGWEFKIWDVGTQRLLKSFDHYSFNVRVAFNRDGSTLAAGASAVDLYDVNDWRLRSSPSRHSDRVTSVAVSPDGRTLVSASMDKTVKLWDLGAASFRQSIDEHARGVRTVVFSPDGRWFASAGDDSVVAVWDAATGESKGRFNRHSDAILTLAASPDSKILASAGVDRVIRLWNVENGQLRSIEAHDAPITAVAFSPDGLTLASASEDKSVKIWEVASGHVVHSLGGHAAAARCLAFSPDRATLASGDDSGTIRLWDLKTGWQKLALQKQTEPVNSLSYSPDGTRLASASSDGNVRIWAMPSGELRQSILLAYEHGQISQVVFTPDGRHLVTANFNGTVYVLRLENRPGAASGGPQQTQSK